MEKFGTQDVVTMSGPTTTDGKDDWGYSPEW